MATVEQDRYKASIDYRSKPVRTEMVRAFCPCGHELSFTGNAMTAWNTSYLHKCRNCNREVWLDSSFPKVDYKELESESTP